MLKKHIVFIKFLTIRIFKLERFIFSIFPRIFLFDQVGYSTVGPFPPRACECGGRTGWGVKNMTNLTHYKISKKLRSDHVIILKRAKILRKNSTEAEQKLWYFLRRKQFSNVKFRRQFPVDCYIVDFISFEAKLIIEADGGDHNLPENIQYDKRRTVKLEKFGYKVLRFWNDEILNDIEIVLDMIQRSIDERLK
jgi:very-short-patch-repair endonuclease